MKLKPSYMKAKTMMSLLAGGLLFTACSSENIWDYDGSQTNDSEDYVDVTFKVSSEMAAMTTRGLTRADENADNPGGPGQWQTLSLGSKIDMLVYAVYDQDETPLTQYGEGLQAAAGQVVFTDATPAIAMKDETGNAYQHKGQTIVNVGDILADGGSYTVTLRLMRKKTYTVAFWAQSSETQAYVTDDLRHVEVIYDNAINNDEYRDAFCKSESFTVTEGGINQEVILTRPFAQINVGTTGADYKNLEIGQFTGSTHKKVTYSKAVVNGVSRYLDVVKNKVLTDSDIKAAIDDTHPYYGLSKSATLNVIFDWAKIPAYYNMAIPSSGYLYTGAEGEEYLAIDLNHDGKILDYKTSYPTLGSQGSYMTEKFKYLSMSYVLVGATNDASADQTLDDWINSSKVLNNVTVFFTEDNNGAADASKAFQSLTVNNVPAQTNWRTNILGGLKWMKDPTDPNPDPENPDNPYDDPDYPDNPDDPNTPPQTPPDGPDDTTIFNTQLLKAIIVSDFFDDNNESVIWSEQKVQ